MLPSPWFPLKRVGNRGENKWERISRDEAYDLIEKRMKDIKAQHGPESMVFLQGTGRDIGGWISMLAYAYGSPNRVFGLSGIACYTPRLLVMWLTQGDFCVGDAAQAINHLWCLTGNPLACTGMEPVKWQAALKKLDFTVCVDPFMTPTAMLADVVLPAATFLEKDSLKGWWVPLQAIKKVVTVGECKSDIEINMELARRFNPQFPWQTPQEMFDTILKPGFQTPSGKIELYSSRLEKWNLDPLPFYEEPPYSPVSTPELYEKYPLILTTGRRSVASFHSEHRQIPWLREIDPDAVLEIHPQTAKALGISHGETVWIENQFGKCKRVALITPDKRKSVIWKEGK